MLKHHSPFFIFLFLVLTVVFAQEGDIAQEGDVAAARSAAASGLWKFNINVLGFFLHLDYGHFVLGHGGHKLRQLGRCKQVRQWKKRDYCPLPPYSTAPGCVYSKTELCPADS